MNNKKIRLSNHDLQAITSLFGKHFLPDNHLWMFGSRVDLTKKGGDIDLYVETTAVNAQSAIKMKSDFLWNVEQAIGEQKIDIVLNLLSSAQTLPIHNVARTQGIQIV